MDSKPEITKEHLVKVAEYIYEIPTSFRSDMRVPARVFTNEAMLDDILQDNALAQLVNVSTLDGIERCAYAMPDIHQGYGFPIGGVSAHSLDKNGIISPGGIGYDINCGVRLLSTSLSLDEVLSYLPILSTKLFEAVPSGVGKGGLLKLDTRELDNVLECGARYMLRAGYGVKEDLTFCEEEGEMSIAQASLVSDHAKKRGSDQVGTLGSGNHFLEVQYVDEIFDTEVATLFGIEKGQVMVMIHCGSRGLGHQVCTDYVRIMMKKLPEWGYSLPDKELACAPFSSKEGQEYFAAMAAAANYAWANRHVIADAVRKTFHNVIGQSVSVDLVYDVSHNMGKKELHTIDGKDTWCIVHRKGATRSFGPGREEIPKKYQACGQPVLIPGTMGTSSYVLAGTEQSMQTAFGSCCHGAGRKMSRMKAKKSIHGATLRKELKDRGIIIRTDSTPGLAEEAPEAYKDVEEVVEVAHVTGLARKVARLKPLAVIKG